MYAISVTKLKTTLPRRRKRTEMLAQEMKLGDTIVVWWVAALDLISVDVHTRKVERKKMPID